MKKETLTKEELNQLAILEQKIEEYHALDPEEYSRYIELKDRLDSHLLKGE